MNKRSLLTTLAHLALAAGTLATTSHALAQSWPGKPVHLVVGYTVEPHPRPGRSRPAPRLGGEPLSPCAAGGASDTVGRLIATELQAINGQPFIVDNKPGVGGMLGMSAVAKAPPDGYTIGVAVSGTMVTGPHLQKNTPYDPLTAFAPVAMVAKAPMVLLASPALAEPTVAAIVRQAREQPGSMMFASGAQAFELAMQLFNAKAGVKLGSVPYPGGAQASIDVMSGRVPVMVDTIGAQLANVKAGKLKAVAVLDSKRSQVLPDVPTVAEAGVPGYEAVGWLGIVAPKGTPPDIVAKLSRQLAQVMAMPAIADKLTALGFEPDPSTPQAFEQAIRTEHAKWGDVVRQAGIAPQ